MNIFATSPNPEQAAIALDDRRLNKMILETGQIISTVLRKNGCTDDRLYKATHQNHPCTIWSGRYGNNFFWIVSHFEALANEFNYRRDKSHATFGALKDPILEAGDFYPKLLLEDDKPHIKAEVEATLGKGAFRKYGVCETFENCTTYKHIDDPVTAYQMYMVEKWNDDRCKPQEHLWPKWTRRGKPTFFHSHIKEMLDAIPDI